MKTDLWGNSLQSPVIVGSGPLSYSGEGMIRLHEAGAGAVVTKTITREAADNPFRHMVLYGQNTLLNCEKWSDYPMEQWLSTEIPKAYSAGVKCIASVGHTVEDSRLCVEQLQDLGCIAIELVSYRDKTILPMLRDTKKRVKIPVIVKLSPNSPDFLEFAARCEAEGADGFTACDSIGPAMKIDIETGRPVLGGAGGTGWLSGAMIHPFTVEKICRLRAQTSLPIIGLGGVAKWQDAIEMVMAGADFVGICSTVILKGPEWIGKLNRQIDEYLEKKGYKDFSEISGIVHQFLPDKDQKTFRMGYEPEGCSRCGKCIRVCPYRARRFDENKRMLLDEKLCRKCGLCVSVCPDARALKTEEY